MKWNTTDYKGNPVTYYTGDVIEKIKELCNENVSESYQIIKKILKFIENEDK